MNDYVELQAIQTSRGALNIGGDAELFTGVQ